MATKLIVLGSSIWMGSIAHYGYPIDPVGWFIGLPFSGQAALGVSTILIFFGLVIYND